MTLNTTQASQPDSNAEGNAATDTGENKFDLSKVNVDELPAEIREQIKGFQADYTRKTQALAEEKKKLQDRVKHADDWDQWYDRNKNTLEEFNEYARKISSGENVHKDNRSQEHTNDDGTDDELFDDSGNKLKKEMINLESKFETGKRQLEQSIALSNRMLLELMEEIQVGDYPFKVNPKKVIEFANKEGVSDVKKAIHGAYRDELIEAEVKKRVEEKLEAEREKDIKVVTGNMPQGRMVRNVIKRGENGLPTMRKK